MLNRLKAAFAVLLLLTFASCQREPTLEELQQELIAKQQEYIHLLEYTVKERDSDLKAMRETMQQHLKEQH